LYSSLLVEAGRTLSYVETVAPSKSDSFHRQIKQVYEEDLQEAFEEIVRWAVAHLEIKKVSLAVDCKRDPYWGKKSRDIVRGEHENGTNKAFEWVVISIISPISIPLMALPLFKSSERAEKTMQVLEFALRLPIKIEKCYFDRGFFISRLLGFLENKKIPYLMLAPSGKALKRYASKTKRFAWFYHTVKKKHWDKAKTTILVVKRKERKKIKPFYYATNLKPTLQLHFDYKKRWQIETDFRVIGEAKIKSKSNVHIIRYFYFLVQLVLLVDWTTTKQVKGPILFKRFLQTLINKRILYQSVT